MSSMSPSGSGGASQEDEYLVRIPAKNDRKSYHMMKFNQSLNIDTSKWTQVKMVRENNRKEFVRDEDELPKFGAGSEFGRQEKEEARRKKFGITTKRYNPDNQPWLLRVGSKKEGKTYKGIREGGVSENTAYYVFTHAPDGSFEAHPVKEWYNFTPRVTYRTLNAEEAEERFAERGKILNHFAVMVNRKLRPNQDEADDGDEEGGKSKKGKSGGGSKKDFKVSDMDDWVDSADELDSDSDDEGSKKKKKADDSDDDGKKSSRSKDSKKKAGGKKKKKKTESDEESEAEEDSDDGDDEGREVDYMSDESSDSEEEMMKEVDIKGVDQDKAMSAMLDSESSSEDEDADKKKDEDEEKPEEDGAGKKGKKKESKDEKNGGGKRSTKSSANNSRSTTPTQGDGADKTDGGAAASEEKAARAEKRKAIVDSVLDINGDPPAKKSRNEPFSSSTSIPPPPPANSVEAAFEEDVRRYLLRKPMTTTELLKKFKSKKMIGLPKDELMPVLLNVLKRLNPIKQKIKGIMYLSLKADNK